MGMITGNDGAILLGSTTLAAVRNFSVELTADTIEKTTMGNDTRQFLKGMSTYTGSADIYFDPADWGNTDSSTFNLTYQSGSSLVGASGITFKGYVVQDATNDVAFTGTVIITGYTVNSSMDGMVEASISFQGTGNAVFSATGNV
jgi:hypothetical protein